MKTEQALVQVQDGSSFIEQEVRVLSTHGPWIVHRSVSPSAPAYTVTHRATGIAGGYHDVLGGAEQLADALAAARIDEGIRPDGTVTAAATARARAVVQEYGRRAA